MSKFFVFFVIVVLSLQARLDPFEPVSVKQERPDNLVKSVYSPDDKRRTVKLVPEIEKKNVNKKTSDFNKGKKVTAKECEVIINSEIKRLKEEALKKEKIIKKLNKKKKYKKIVKIKDKEFIPVIYKVLPFITIDIGRKYISVISRPRYKVLRYYFLSDDKKIVFDFKAKVNMRTRYKLIENHPYFKAYKIGNHPEMNNNFFRVVIELKKAAKKFKVIINQNKATLIYRK